MAYVAGDTITAGEYNAFVTNSSSPFGYNHFAGVGATVYGLGQTEIGAVSGTETTVTAANWNSLITGLVNMADHQQLSITAKWLGFRKWQGEKKIESSQSKTSPQPFITLS